jgi:hypothetical protein
MTRRESRDARRNRERDLALLRAAVEEFGGRVYGTDWWIRRLVSAGLAESPQYAHGAARDATAEITDAGRRLVEEAG